MPTTLQGHIKTALLARADKLAQAMSLPISHWDKADFLKPVSGGKPLPFLEAKVFTAPTAELHVGPDDEESLTGFLQINLNWPQNSGEVPPADAVGRVLTYFKRGTAMQSGPVQVDIQRAPSAATPFIETPYTKTQITIPYQVYARQF